MIVPGHFDVEATSTEDAIAQLHRSGWHLSVTAFTDIGGRTVWEIAGRLGKNQLRVEGSTRDEAWHKAALAAASCRMLRGWRRPPTGRE
jgi:hypothetical protein